MGSVGHEGFGAVIRWVLGGILAVYVPGESSPYFLFVLIFNSYAANGPILCF